MLFTVSLKSTRMLKRDTYPLLVGAWPWRGPLTFHPATAPLGVTLPGASLLRLVGSRRALGDGVAELHRRHNLIPFTRLQHTATVVTATTSH